MKHHCIQPQKQVHRPSDSPFLILAPLQGYTDLTFRNVFARHFRGIDQAMAPFISTMGHQKIRVARFRDVEPSCNLLPVVPQMMGNCPEDLCFLANRLFDMGHDTVNLNLGCPHTKIAKKKRGSGLLPHPEKIDRILGGMLCDMRPKLTVKLRLGYHSPDEIHALIPVLNRHDLGEIILHPRTGIQMYQGGVDVNGFSVGYEQISHKLTYNGDIVDVASFSYMRQRFPKVKSFMIGRGLLSNPFLGEEIRGIHMDSADKRQRLHEFHDDLFASYQEVLSGPAHVMNRMKGFWKFFGPSFQGSKAPLKRLLKSRNIEDLRHRAEALFVQCPHFFPVSSSLPGQ